jgi:hypothetical protein
MGKKGEGRKNRRALNYGDGDKGFQWIRIVSSIH